MKKTLPIQNRNYTSVFRWLLIIAILIQMPGVSFAQNVVSGTVISQEDGSPIPGASVVIRNTSLGTVTDTDGRYTLNVEPSSVLVFSFVGFNSQEVAVGTQSVVNITMSPTVQSLQEVVVTGYSTQRKDAITGSVSVVDVDAMKQLPVTNAQNALQGLASGVNVVGTGNPGVASEIRIRGLSSFGSTAPLVIVDGIQQDLHYVNPNDIESIQVLKDAGAASIYGVRGSNGVIIVTTKKGKVGAPQLTYDAWYGMKYPLPGNVWDLMNSTDYMEVYNKAYPGNVLFTNGMPDYTYRGPGGAGVAMEGDPEVDPSLYFYEKTNTGKNYIIQKVNKGREDWFHHLFKKAPSQSHTLTASGGTERSRYLFALNYVDEQGTLSNTFSKRYSARINTEFTINDHLRIGENANIFYRQLPGFGEDAEFGGIAETYKHLPITPLKDIMGNWAGTFGGPSLGSFTNPIAVQDRNVGKDLNYDWHIVGNVYAELDFLKDFTLRTSIGYNIVNSYDQNFSATQTENVQSNTGDNGLNVSAAYSSRMFFTNTLNYDKTFGKHHIQFVGGTEAIKFVSRGVSGGSSKLFSEDFNYLILGNGTLQISNSSSISENRLFSMFGRVDYSFDDKYLLGVTVRRDGSSVFGPENRYGVFPAVSAGWRISKEAFMQNIGWLNDLKIKGSYGVLGSQNNVGATNAFSLYSSGLTSTYYDITGASTALVQGFGQSRIGNLATGWEENIVSNFGFDATLFENRLDVNVEYFKKSIKGLLFTAQLPGVILGGATAPTVNIGDIQNSGVDAAVNYRGNLTSDMRFNVGVNITTYKNEVVDIPDPGYFYSGSTQGIGSIARNEEGHPASSFYGYKITGLFQSDAEVASAPIQQAAAPGRFRYQDTNDDGEITELDRVYLGDPNPDFTYGVNLGLNYKNFDLAALFYGSQGNDIYNTTRAYLHFMQVYQGGKSNVLKNAWTPENPNTTVPRIDASSNFSTNSASTSYYIEDGSYLRLKSVMLGYNFNPALVNKIGINKLRLYGQAANLFTITNYSGLDPEIGGDAASFGIDIAGYPANELQLIFGVNVGF